MAMLLYQIQRRLVTLRVHCEHSGQENETDIIDEMLKMTDDFEDENGCDLEEMAGESLQLSSRNVVLK